MTVDVVLLAHGSPDPRHGQDIEDLAERVRGHVDRPVHVAYLDHQPPSPAALGATLTGSELVVVPLLLAAGFHSRVDVPVAAGELAGGKPCAIARVLGPDPLLEEAAAELRRRTDVSSYVPTFLAAGILRDREVEAATGRGEVVVTDALARTGAVARLVASRIREGIAALSR